MSRLSTVAAVRLQGALRSLLQRARAEAGEGVISAAIVVLIMALIGAAMWVAFQAVFQDASTRASGAVQQIGG
ncbi:MAG: hypothetical protein WD010_03075 [Nitriliruptor sp.]|uniref:hypothetical protein n=1 Tax=Nitriliruptor sp. TaxID=2448056 RepID=UPI0034A0124C